MPLRLRCVLDEQQQALPFEQRRWQLCHLGTGDIDRKRPVTMRMVTTTHLYTPGFSLVASLGYQYGSGMGSSLGACVPAHGI